MKTEDLRMMELLVEAEVVRRAKLELLLREANELVTITVASINTTRGHTR